jgi:2-phosphosulfolactate phosphatase
VCSGQGGYFSFEDFLCAGLLVRAILGDGPPRYQLDDGARVALEIARTCGSDLGEELRRTDHGRRLVELGFEEDLRRAAELDRFPFVPVLRDGRLVAEDVAGDPVSAR